MAEIMYYKKAGKIIPIPVGNGATFTIKKSPNNCPYWELEVVWDDGADYFTSHCLLYDASEEEARAELDRINARLAELGLVI